jgi:hypothetical protein
VGIFLGFKGGYGLEFFFLLIFFFSLSTKSLIAMLHFKKKILILGFG